MWPCPGDSLGWGVISFTRKVGVQFLVRAHIWILGSIPGQGASLEVTNSCFSLPPNPRSLFLSLKINEHIPSGEDLNKQTNNNRDL